ncbi:galactose-3-O-sulfotransferase 2-like isoform X2 [Pomacea canaliculata]|uniref:galactose-3-O-sulfotransferase 2-like isoform X2 n=1 Tax=Pomacea canaliculata TaxID=400727 RepID=UPI000D735E8D|nr:galactose-3-O-sulfotransferase 2-like isoform X2 [Pomacea canaliculata]
MQISGYFRSTMKFWFLLTVALASILMLFHLHVINRHTREAFPFSTSRDTWSHDLTSHRSRRTAPPLQSGTNSVTWREEQSKGDQETHHVFFLKVHKAASTTVLGVMLRFALSRQLAVMLPKRGNVLAEDTKFFHQNVLRLPEGRSHYDMLCNHLVFEERLIRRTFLHPDAKFLAIVRHPFDQFISAFQYYRKVYSVPYLTKIPGRNPIATYLKNPDKWEPINPLTSYTNNRMSFDFGMKHRYVSNETYVDKYVEYLENTFDLVLVVEMFDESMILMKRLLGWRLQDILYIKSNRMHDKQEYFFTNQDRKIHRKLRTADYTLYNHFYKVLRMKISAAGPGFFEEVMHFRNIQQNVEKFCLEPKKSLSLFVNSSSWNEAFHVSYLDCVLFKMEEVELVDVARRKLGPLDGWPELSSFNALFF